MTASRSTIAVTSGESPRRATSRSSPRGTGAMRVTNTTTTAPSPGRLRGSDVNFDKQEREMLQGAAELHINNAHVVLGLLADLDETERTLESTRTAMKALADATGTAQSQE